jgi:hypothetical protein
MTVPVDDGRRWDDRIGMRTKGCVLWCGEGRRGVPLDLIGLGAKSSLLFPGGGWILLSVWLLGAHILLSSIVTLCMIYFVGLGVCLVHLHHTK